MTLKLFYHFRPSCRSPGTLFAFAGNTEGRGRLFLVRKAQSHGIRVGVESDLSSLLVVSIGPLFTPATYNALPL